jgi:hypothetical protein
MPPPLSQSRRERMACPHLYQITIIDKVPTPPSAPAADGSDLHKLIAAYVQHCWKTRQQTDYDFIDSLNFGARENALKLFRAIAHDLVIDHERILGVEMKLELDADLQPVHRHDWSCLGVNVKVFCDDCYSPDEPCLDCENRNRAADLSGNVCTVPENEAHFESTLDLVHLPADDECVIDDWKSNWQIFKPDTFQAQLYPLQIFQHYPSVDRVSFRLRFVRYGLPCMREVEFIRDRDLDWLINRARDERARQLKLHADADEGIRLRALPGDHCAWCPRTKECPVREINPYTSQTPEDLLRFARWATEARNQAVKVLKAHVDANGPVIIADANDEETVADFMRVEKLKYPVADCLPVLRDWEQSSREGLLDKLTIGGMSQKLKAKKREGLKAQLEPYAIRVPETRFVISGTEEEPEEE